MRISEVKHPSIETLTMLILSAGFGAAAAASTLLIVFAPALIGGWQGEQPVDRQALTLTALAVVGVLGVALLITLALMQRLVIRRMRREIEMHTDDLGEQRSVLIAQLREAAAQEERNRLARDLHDTIKQQLFSVNVAAATAQSLCRRDPDGAAQHMQHVRDLSQAALAEMKALLTHLRPQPLATIGLIEAIREQLEALRFRAEVTTGLRHGPLPDEERLPPGAQETIFRVVQEALSNTARHARARHVHVTLTQETAQGRDWLQVCVEDDGQGFDPSTTPSGMGLANMHTRIEPIGGSLHVRSAPGQGTTVQFRIPLTTQHEREEKERRMKEERLQQVYGASGLSSLAATALLISGALMVWILTHITTGESGVWSYLAGLGIIGAIASVPLIIASLNWRRRALEGQPSDSVWRRLIHYYDTGAVFTLLIVLAWIAFSLRAFPLATIVLVATAAIGALHIRFYRMLNTHIREWATLPALRARLREQLLLIGFMIVFQIMVYGGFFGSMAAVRLFHETLDLSWFVSFLAIFYPLFIVVSILSALLIHYQIRRLETLEGTQITAEPAPDIRVQRVRRIASSLTLAYHLLGVAIGALALHTPAGAIIPAVAAVTLLAVKWRTERSLTARIGEWSSLQEQESALTIYVVFLGINITGILGGIVGYLIASGEPDSGPNAAAPSVALWMLDGFGTWWLCALLYLAMQTVVSWRRVRALSDGVTSDER
jgi:signal transduction histidine kinase